MGDAKYDSRITHEQKEILITFMEEHPEFARGKLLGVHGRKTKNSLWDVLAEQLNNCGGPEKNTAKWQRVWTDLKNKIKKKANDGIKRARQQTGGGPPPPGELTELETKVIGIMSEEAVHGLRGMDGVPLDTEEPLMVAVHDQENVDPNIRHDHDYAWEPPQYREPAMSLPSPSGSIVSETTMASASDGTSHRARPQRRTRHQTTASDAMEKFAAIGESLNVKMDVVADKLNDLVEEIRKTNVLFKELVQAVTQGKD